MDQIANQTKDRGEDGGGSPDPEHPSVKYDLLRHDESPFFQLARAMSVPRSLCPAR
jgi:hypothetical protein